jgi:hypothetical protein
MRRRPTALLVTLAAFAGLACVAGAGDEPTPTKPSDKFKVTSKRTDDSVEVRSDKDEAVVVVKCPFGISQATVERRDDKWPAGVVVRLHLKGLERFDAGNGKVTLHAAAGIKDGKPDVRQWKDDKEADRLKPTDPLWAAINVRDGDGKQAKALPLKDGYFEIKLPKAFFEGNPKSVTLKWIDFYR